jgi:hypothetical protein
MIRLIFVAAFALAVATSAHAITLAPLHKSAGVITQVRHACGAGMHWVNGVGCVTASSPSDPQVCIVGCRARLP